MAKYKIEFQIWDSLDIKTLAQVSADVRRSEGLGDYTNQQMEEYLKTMNERFPAEVIVIATEKEKIVGWMGIERITDNMGEVGRWQPFVISPSDKHEIARHLVSNIVDYARSNDMTRIGVSFGGISKENLDTFKDRIEWYEAGGWTKLEDTNFMVSNPDYLQNDKIQTPEGFEVRPLFDFDNDTIFECYLEAFTSGEARWIYDMTEEQRRQEFDKLFDRTPHVNEDASHAIVSDGDIAGFILVVSRSDEEEHLECIGVHPKFRGKGIAKALLSNSFEVLKDQKADHLTLGVDPVNTPAVKLYEQFGFETVSRIARYSWKTDD